MNGKLWVAAVFAVLGVALDSQSAHAASENRWEAGAGAVVQPDVLLVRASASADASVVTRLPINHPVTVVDGKTSGDGYIAVWFRNEETLGRADSDAVVGFVRADMIGERQTAEKLEQRLAGASSPAEQWTLLERLVALRGDDADKQRLRDLAQESGDKERIAKANRLLEPAPTVIGICFGGQVAILAQLKGKTFESLVERVDSADKDSPQVKAAEARLRVRALELTTLRFWRFAGGTETGFLVEPKVVTRFDVTDTARSHIELGPCPVIRGEVSWRNGLVFVSAPVVFEQDAMIPTAELARYVGLLPPPIHGLRMFSPAGRLVELDTSGAVYLFQRGTPGIWACSADTCTSRRIEYTQAPVWLRLRSGEQMRIASRTENVDSSGWGSPANAGQWVHPEFVIEVFNDKGVIAKGEFVLDQYGC